MENNIAETFNGWILGIRLKPIILILKEIRMMIMQRLYTKKVFTNKWHYDISPRVMNKLEENKKYVLYWRGRRQTHC